MATTSKELTLIEQLENAGVWVVVDEGDPVFAQELPFVPHGMTSNQAIILGRLKDEANKELIQRTMEEMKGSEWLDVLTVLTARFHKLALPYVSGRVFAQVSTRYINDKARIVGHALTYQKAYHAEGIDDDHFCIKIPTTTAGMQAAVELHKRGITTLATSVFSLAQAIAAAQAGSAYLAPYFNEIRAHSDKQAWPDVEDPATQHTFSARLIHIRDAYGKLKAQGKQVPRIMTASIISAREAMAQIELGVDETTLPGGVLRDLTLATRLPEYKQGDHMRRLTKEDIDSPHFRWQDWTPPEPSVSEERMRALAKTDPLSKVMIKDVELASLDVDYLADGVLDQVIAKDQVCTIRLRDAIELFDNTEDESRRIIVDFQSKL